MLLDAHEEAQRPDTHCSRADWWLIDSAPVIALHTSMQSLHSFSRGLQSLYLLSLRSLSPFLLWDACLTMLSQRFTFTMLTVLLSLCGLCVAYSIQRAQNDCGPRCFSTSTTAASFSSIGNWMHSISSCCSATVAAVSRWAPVHRLVQWCSADAELTAAKSKCPLTADSTAYCDWHTHCVSLTAFAVVHS